MLANILKVNSEGLYQSSGKKKVVVLCLVFPSLTKCEFRELSCCSCAMTAKKCIKKHDAHACKVVVLLI